MVSQINHLYSLDIITDGSERTGMGTSFLTIQQRRSCDFYNSSLDEKRNYLTTEPILARYAFNMSESTVRSCADQKQKLSKIKAVFHNSLHPSCLSGTPSLLYALKSSDTVTAKSLHICGPKGIAEYMDAISGLVYGRQGGIPIVSCECPNFVNVESKKLSWWKVFEDSFITVHARTYDFRANKNDMINPRKDYIAKRQKLSSAFKTTERHFDNSLSQYGIMYIITLKKSSSEPSIAIAPMGAPLHPLPDCVVKVQTHINSIEKESVNNQRPLLMTLHTNEINFSSNIHNDQQHHNINDTRVRITKLNQSLSQNHYVFGCPSTATTSSSNNMKDIDYNPNEQKGILRKARKWSELFHTIIPCAFPLFQNIPDAKISTQMDKDKTRLHYESVTKRSDIHNSSNSCKIERIQSCQTIVFSMLGELTLMERKNSRKSPPGQIEIYSRNPLLTNSVSSSTTQQMIQNFKSIFQNPLWIPQINKIHDSFRNPFGSFEKISSQQTQLETIKDVNEIVIDGEEIEDERGEEIDTNNNDEIRDVNDIDLEDEEKDDANDEEICQNKPTKIDYDSPKSQDVQNETETKYEKEIHLCHKNSLDGLPPVPHLLVLGTGCASPSAIRGSSGYALLLPTKDCYNPHDKSNKHLLAAIIDCGEGCLTSLSRYLPISKNSTAKENFNLSNKLTEIKWIWISHSHFDHYGGLPTILHAIYDEVQNSSSEYLPPILIAPPKVLKYLDCALSLKNGVKKSYFESEKGNRSNDSRSSSVSSAKQRFESRFKTEHRFFFGVTPNEFEYSPFAQQYREMLFGYSIPLPYFHNRTCTWNDMQNAFYRPFASFRSIPVEHCPCAYALHFSVWSHSPRSDAQYNYSSSSLMKEYIICYSGDTRPSQRLVQHCNHHTLQYRKKLSLLIHESTFDSNAKGLKEAIKKRHSTVQEALTVADKVDAYACLLSHFSQRYPRGISLDGQKNLHGDDEKSTSKNETLEKSKNVCVAVDGLLLPLTDHAMDALPIINDFLNRMFQVSD